MHARALTHYSVAGPGTGPPFSLSRWDKAKLLLTGVEFPRPEITKTPADFGLPFTTHTIAAHGVTLEAWHIPSTAPRGLVLLFHGHRACKSALLGEAAAFRELGYSSLLVDFRGSGGSSEAITTIGVLEADDVAAAVEFARATWKDERLILFGQSMGAAAILRAVAHGVTADALLLECPFDRFLTAVENRFEMLGVPSFPMARLLLFWGGVQNGFDPFGHNPVDYAAAVHCPTLLMQGLKDKHVRLPEAEAVYAALAGPKQWELFAEAGHQSYCSKWGERWKSVVAVFLDEHLKGPGESHARR
jgi:pimeloyl-ACP methyl ester carboxylesterase